MSPLSWCTRGADPAPPLVRGVGGGPAVLCVRTALSLCSGGSDTPALARCLGVWYHHGIMKKLVKGNLHSHVSSPRTRGLEQSTLVTTSGSDSRVSLCLQVLFCSRAATGLVKEKMVARQATNRSRKWRRVWKSVSEQDEEACLCGSESERVLPVIFLQLCFFFFLLI